MGNKIKVSARIGRSGKSAIGGLIVNGKKVSIEEVETLGKSSTAKKPGRCKGCSRKNRNA